MYEEKTTTTMAKMCILARPMQKRCEYLPGDVFYNTYNGETHVLSSKMIRADDRGYIRLYVPTKETKMVFSTNEIAFNSMTDTFDLLDFEYHNKEWFIWMPTIEQLCAMNGLNGLNELKTLLDSRIFARITGYSNDIQECLIIYYMFNKHKLMWDRTFEKYSDIL